MPITGSHLTRGMGWDLLPDQAVQQGVWFRPLVTTHALTFPKGDIGFAAYFISIKTFLAVEPVMSVQSVPLLQQSMTYKPAQSSEEGKTERQGILL